MTVDKEFVKWLVEHFDGDAWVLADHLAEVFPESEYPLTSGVNSGLRAVLVEHVAAARREYGVDIRADYLRQIRATAILWPGGDRSPSAPFTVHYMLRGEDRFDRMRRYQEKARKHENSALTPSMVRRYRDEERGPRIGKQWDERVRDAITRAAKRVLLDGRVAKDKTDWWTLATPRQRRIVAEQLRAVAAMIEGSDDAQD